MTHSIGLIGYGRIGSDIAERVRADPDFELEYVFVRERKASLSDSIQLTDPTALAEHAVDIAVEAATPAALDQLAAPILKASDLLVLSGSAFADPDTERSLRRLTNTGEHDVYLPHAALFGIDGLVDARSELESVVIEATKAPGHLDFEYAGEVDPGEIEGRTVLYEGSTRGLCRRFPRNFNSHAAVAMAGLGLDETTSRLVADPAAETARHVTTATGDGFELEAVRDSDIEGVTGDYTLVSTWGSMRRILQADDGPVFV
ncbi:MAG: putative dinucleotide-utilizing enzyme [uncultured archaeon A07HR60]|jgi:Predicted dinucleotide-utilizing enzyme|nr:MAG: putative dinucleotide-utilizing enzyme [uncultured archaeon A07HR60]